MWTAALWVGWREELRWGGQKRTGVKTPNLPVSLRVWQKSRDKRIIFVCLFCIFEGERTQAVCMQTSNHEKELFFELGGSGDEKILEQDL